MFAWPTLWVYLLAATLGGIAAGLSLRALNPDDS
jgi:aquaporin Z